jgi:hypothetical protein
MDETTSGLYIQRVEWGSTRNRDGGLEWGLLIGDADSRRRERAAYEQQKKGDGSTTRAGGGERRLASKKRGRRQGEGESGRLAEKLTAS